MVAERQVADRLDTHVPGEHEIASGDKLLRSTLRRVGLQARAGKEPDDHEARKPLDEAVCAEADQRDRARGNTGANGDAELDQMPRVAAPRERSRTPLQPGAIRRRHCRRPPQRGELNGCLRHDPKVPGGPQAVVARPGPVLLLCQGGVSVTARDWGRD